MRLTDVIPIWFELWGVLRKLPHSIDKRSTDYKSPVLIRLVWACAMITQGLIWEEEGFKVTGIPKSKQNKDFVYSWVEENQIPSHIRTLSITMDYRTEAPTIIREFLTYHETIQGHSKRTADEYFLDLRNFFRYIKIERGLVPRSAEFNEISIEDVDLSLVQSVTLTDVYAYMSYLSRDRAKHPNSRDTDYGLTASARARKVATIRSFYKYLTNKAKLLQDNPMQDLDSPRQKKALPHYLDLESSVQLLDSVNGVFRERDYCILTLFLNCGLRISELIGLNLSDVREDQLRVLGKGNKERILYLNDACQLSIQDWIEVRNTMGPIDKNALFISQRRTRLSKAAVEKLVKKYLTMAGLDSSQYSPHKLRHTAATLMLQNGVDVRTLQEVLGHEHLNTTQIYTHVDNENLRTAAKANPLGYVRQHKSRQPKNPVSGQAESDQSI